MRLLLTARLPQGSAEIDRQLGAQRGKTLFLKTARCCAGLEGASYRGADNMETVLK